MKNTCLRCITIFSLIALFLAATPRAAHATDWEEVGLWTGAGFASLLYLPIKGVVCLLMGLGGGLSYAGTVPADATQVSDDIIKWGFYGDWLIRPEHLVLDTYPQILGFDETVHFLD